MIAGIFAFMPIDEATTVHTTLQSASQATTQTTTIRDNSALEVRDQDRVVVWDIDATATITDFSLIPDSDVDISGNLTAVLVDEGASGSSTVNCQDANDDDLTISSGLNTINTAGTVVNSILPGDCEAIEVDVADGDHIIISLLIDITEEG